MAGRNHHRLDRRESPIAADKTAEIIIGNIGVRDAVDRLVGVGRGHGHHATAEHIIGCRCRHFHAVVAHATAKLQFGSYPVEALGKEAEAVSIHVGPEYGGEHIKIGSAEPFGVPVIGLNIGANGPVCSGIRALIQSQAQAPGYGLGVREHFHHGFTETEVIHDVVDIRLPGQQVPVAVRHRRTELQTHDVGIGFWRIHAGAGVFHIPLFLAAHQTLDKEAVVRLPRSIQASLGVLVGAADLVAVAVLVIVRLVVSPCEAKPGTVATHCGTAIDQLAIAVVSATHGEVTGRA